jgi:glycine betaine/proline transport system permease protein
MILFYIFNSFFEFFEKFDEATQINIGDIFETIIDWLTVNFEALFDFIRILISGLIDGIENGLVFLPSIILIIIATILICKFVNIKIGILSTLGLLLINSLGLWEETMQTLSLVITSTLIALIIGIPLGIFSSRSSIIDKITRPILDFMQTMPAFVYLIPAVIFFDLGEVPASVATVIFAMPPVARLTNLGIRQVPKEVVEASKSFGSTELQLLVKVQLPLAKPTILAGINQTIMLALSMVVISAMIGASGLGEVVLKGITQMEIGKGFEGGLAVVILAMLLDRITQASGTKK